VGIGEVKPRRILNGEFKDNQRIAYVSFNALKYAEKTPLQRHFLSQIAAAFRIDDPKYSRDLYKSVKGTDFKLTIEKVKRLAAVLAGAVGAVMITVALFALLAAAIASSRHSYWHNVAQTLRGSASGVILSATLLTAVLALLSQSLRVDTVTNAPSSSEEFERLFRELVADVLKETRRTRLVVFIDELDRCSPDQVVSVLETLRTFLEVDGSVFVVAADQQALERAATEAARQSTPANPGNPYYSAGSAYLDKIFQYQFPMPPLLPRRLSRFALDLIQDRPGVWQEIPNQPELVSVLVPTHVRSPRRVKALLNSFALSFRLALSRSAEGVLDPGVEARASEIGKLVCLRTEFPLFAADLQLDARLPQLTLMLRDDPGLKLETCGLHGVAPEAFARARAYAREELPVDEVIVRSSEREAGEDTGTTTLTPVPEAATESRDEDDEEPMGDERDRVEVNHARQLIRYLQRTRDISGPGRDLVFLESSGAAFGLPGELAEQLESDSLDGQARAVAATINTLTADDEYYAALRLLARLVVEAIGIDAHNVLTCLFAAVGSASHPLDPVVDELLTAVASYRSGYDFKPNDLEGALRLSLERDTDAALEVRAAVLARPEALSDTALRGLILRHAPRLTALDLGRVAEVLTKQLAEADGEELSELLATLPLREVESLCAEVDADEFAEEAFAALAQTAAAARAGGHDELGELLLRTLVGLDPAEARTAAEPVLPEFAPISTPATVDAILSATRRRALSAWPNWLSPLDPQATADGDHQQRLAGFVPTLWRLRFKPSANQAATTAEEFEAAADALARHAPVGLDVPAESVSKLLASLEPGAVTTQAAVNEREAQIAALWSLAGRNLLSPAAVGYAVIADLEATLAASVPPAMAAAVATYVVGEASRALRVADALGDFGDTVASSAWIDDPSRLLLRARLTVAESRVGLEIADNLDGEEIAALKDQATPEGFAALSDWLRTFRPGPEVIVNLFDAENR
jgi:KAP family P-loop domain